MLAYLCFLNKSSMMIFMKGSQVDAVERGDIGGCTKWQGCSEEIGQR